MFYVTLTNDAIQNFTNAITNRGPDNTYEKQRQCRMQDAIDDYLSDDKYRQDKHMKMLSCINDVMNTTRKHTVVLVVCMI